MKKRTSHIFESNDKPKINVIPLLFKEIKHSMRVVDNEGLFGVIESCDDIHNVNVVYDNGGAGLYCLDPNCDQFSPLLYAINE